MEEKISNSTLILIIVAILLAVVCYFIIIRNDNDISNAIEKNSHRTIIIDDCEYIKTNELFQFGHSLTHKGNCKNPKHYKIIHDTIYVVRSK